MEARNAASDSVQRLKGKLMFLINDEWVVTDAGLETTESDYCYRWYENPPHGDYIDLHNEPGPPNCQQTLWEEARYYALRLRKKAESDEPF